jgi:hypothetical protein
MTSAPRITSSTACFVLAGRVHSGEELVAAARIVGDHNDYDVWQRRHADWIKETCEALVLVFGGPGSEDEFRQRASVSPQPDSWQQDLSLQVEHSRSALDLVYSLLEKIESGQGVSSEAQRA